MSEIELKLERALNALQYVHEAIVTMADHCDIEAVQEAGIDVQDCRDVTETVLIANGRELPE